MKKIINLINELNEANSLYYNTGNSPLTDEEYDLKLKLLETREKELNIIFSNSPTQKIGAPVLSKKNKISLADKPMLSLAKVHSIEEIQNFEPNCSLYAMPKIDGLSTRLWYMDGQLIKASTRGNGLEGTDITEHIKYYTNIPLKINYNKSFTVDGESYISNKDFEFLNQNNKFKNSRNLAAGTLNCLDMSIVKERKMSFIAWDSNLEDNIFYHKLIKLEALGFKVVNGIFCANNDKNNIEEILNYIYITAFRAGLPIDGVVWRINDVAYGDSLGKTSHHYNYAIAWKKEIETNESSLIKIDWTMGRTGKLTPVAVFKPIEMDGSTITRANLHNLDIMEDLLGRPYQGQKIFIYKANEIIPQIYEAETSIDNKENYINLIDKCPICGHSIEIETSKDGVRNLVCNNPSCNGKLINSLNHFCGKTGLDIKGLSAATLEQLLAQNWINNYIDIFNLKNHREDWIKLDGFGPKSVDNILEAIENSKNCLFRNFICAIGIPLIGKAQSAELEKYFTSYEDFREKINNKFNFCVIDGIAEARNNNILNFDYTNADLVSKFLNIQIPDKIKNIQSIDGLTFVITGRLESGNRNNLTKIITDNGGKVASSISKKTNYLINNDINSNSTKNISAKNLGIPIITEKDFFDFLKK